jgi:hypothetical protein
VRFLSPHDKSPMYVQQTLLNYQITPLTSQITGS